MFIPLSSIIVKERIRQDKKGTDAEWREFVSSFRRLGQLMAIRVSPLPNGQYELIAGERRYLALLELNANGESIPDVPKGEIEAILAGEKNIPRRLKLLMEFDENDKRKDFNFVERARHIGHFHAEMMAETNGQWPKEATAKALGLSPASITQYLKVEEEVKKAPEGNVAKATTLDAAVKRMKNNEQLKIRHIAAQSDNHSFQRASEILTQGDAVELIKSIPDNSVDFINFDPPWGDDVAHKSQDNHEAFDDSTESADALMAILFPHLFRILKDDRFCLFWHRSWASETMAVRAEGYGFNHGPSRTPAIWYKPDKITDQNRQPEKQLIEAYETFFILRKGNPIFYEKQANNVFAFERVKLGSIIHPTEKPVPLCEALISLCTVPGEMVFDPTAGSSAFLEAAVRKSRKARGFELSPLYHERGITRLAEYLKTFVEK